MSCEYLALKAEAVICCMAGTLADNHSHDYAIQEALLGQEKSGSVVAVDETRTSHTTRHVGSTRAYAAHGS
jgi:hypothetical protein